MPVTMSGRLQDFTTRPIEEVTTATIDAPVCRASPSGSTTSKPRKLHIGSDGSFSVTADEGPGALYLEGRGWSQSINFIAAAGHSNFVDAVINAMTDAPAFKDLLRRMM